MTLQEVKDKFKTAIGEIEWLEEMEFRIWNPVDDSTRLDALRLGLVALKEMQAREESKVV